MNIFIGSSSSDLALKIAEAIKKKIKSVRGLNADVVIWHEDFFHPGEATLNTLCKKAIFFDFAIFIGIKEDLELKGGASKEGKESEVYEVVRDNIIFEYGLFSGVLGRQNTFLMVDKDAKLPSDLLGITQIRFKTQRQMDNIVADEDSLKKCYKKIIDSIKEERIHSRIRLLPATTNAISYYENFASAVCSAIRNAQIVTVEGRRIQLHPEKTKLHILLPGTLSNDLKPWAQEVYREKKVAETTIPGPHKPYSIHVKIDEEEVIQIYDVPVILSSSYKAVTLYMGQDFIGVQQDNDIQACLKREIITFGKAVEMIIADQNYGRSNITIEYLKK